MTYKISDLIAPCYQGIHRDMREGLHDVYWLKGGRGSAKSAFLSFEIVFGMLRDENANTLILRRVGSTIKDSVYAQMIWALDMLGIADQFTARVSPYELIRKSTGQRIMFRGTDDPMKLKSIKLTKGYFKYLWCEELAEFRNMEDVRIITQSVFRGVDRAFSFYSYNPPKSSQAWVNKEALKPEPKRLVHSSCYLDLPREWLGERFFADAEALKASNELAYRNEYLGDVTGNGGNVFENVKLREITDEEIEALEWFYQGIDWGYFPDPFVWLRVSYDSKRKTLYFVDECVLNKCSNYESYQRVKDRLKYSEAIYADSAEPKSIDDFRSYGVPQIRSVNKAEVSGTGSVAYSTKWLASLSEIVIDPKRCPVSAQEFIGYEYERNSAGEFVSGFVDENNHCIDACRYATSPIWRRRGQ